VSAAAEVAKSHVLYRIARKIYHRYWIHRRYSRLSTADAFRQIYLTKAWGANPDGFCSGYGSSGETAANYLPLVAAFIKENRIGDVVDLGCGDFQIGKALIGQTSIRYTGVDIVPELIAFNSQKFGDDHVRFQCLDITTDALPPAELCIVRQVFQHLSNVQIGRALLKLRQYRYVLISEHVPYKPRTVNRDKPHGPGIREVWGSGVYIDMPPFSEPVHRVWETPCGNDLLRTVLLSSQSSS
jgi:SAM-dependent methyltransferase